MPTAPDVLHYLTLTNAIDERKSPNSFLKNMFFSRNEPVATRLIELSYMRRGRQIAPFVERNGAAIMVTGRQEEFVYVQPPHIRIKRPMTPSDVLTKRRPGTGIIFPRATDIATQMRNYIANEQEMMLDDCTNSEEWLCAMALTGVISYVAQDESAFTITMPRAAANTVVLTGADLWTAPTTSSPRENLAQAAQIGNDATGLNFTDAIMGSAAADAFLSHPELLTLLTGGASRMTTGTIDLTAQFLESGALFMGQYTNGMRLWRYGRQVNVNGVATSLIRPEYVEFIARTPAAEFVTYYGAIEDFKAMGSSMMQAQRFSKSWEEDDPSARMILVETNPLPVMRRPDASMSMKVV